MIYSDYRLIAFKLGPPLMYVETMVIYFLVGNSFCSSSFSTNLNTNKMVFYYRITHPTQKCTTLKRQKNVKWSCGDKTQ